MNNFNKGGLTLDKVKYVKLEKEDGSFSNPIPLSVDGNYIDINGKTLNEELNDKATKEEVQAVASGSPAGTYTTVAALTTADPNHNKIYLVTADGRWYYYNNGWQSGGIYQATGIEVGSIKDNELKDNGISPQKIKGHSIINIFNKNDVNNVVNKKLATDGTLTTGTNYSTSDYISVCANTTYYSTINMAGNAPAIAFYDKNKTFISYVTTPGTWLPVGSFTTPNYTCYIRVSGSTAGAFSPTSTLGVYTSSTAPVDYIKYGEFTLDGLKINKDNITGYESIITLYVNTTGTDGKMTLKQALESTNTIDKYVIKIDEGIYDILSSYTSTQINNAHYSSSDIRGSFCGPYVDGNITLEGVGNVENTIIKGELPTTYSSSVREQISTLNLQGNVTLKNLTVTAKNIRYPIHDDFQGSANSTITAINCKFIHYLNSTGTGQNNAWGMGCRTGKRTIMEDCYFNPNFYQHTNVGFTSPSKTVLKNCICTRDVTVHDKNSGQENIVEIYNTNSPCIVYQWWANTTVQSPTKIICDNEIPIFYLNNSNHINADIHYIKNNTANTISKGALIKRSTYNSFEVLNDSTSILYGIALEDIEVGQYGRCITKGYIAGDDVGLTPIVNNKYKIENGALIQTTSNDYVAICDISNFIKVL